MLLSIDRAAMASWSVAQVANICWWPLRVLPTSKAFLSYAFME